MPPGSDSADRNDITLVKPYLFTTINKIIKCSEKTVEDIPLIIMSHAGPSGLGSEPKSICGKDWKLPSLDWGDRDLSVAISQIQKIRKVDHVIFGHMQNLLKRNLGLR